MNRKEILEFAAEVSDILAIEPPKIEYRPQEFFPTATMLAMYKTETGVIYVREVDKITPDVLLCVAHELRHCWQTKNAPELFEGYREAQELSIEEYNLQPAEIDANAFAGVIMVNFFGIKPLFQGLPENARDRIYGAMKNMEI